MAQQCELTGKKPIMGNNVSHANNKTRAKWHLNLHTKKYDIPQLSKTVSVKLTTRAIRTIDKQGGLTNAILKAKEENLSKGLKRLKADLKKALRPKAAPQA